MGKQEINAEFRRSGKILGELGRTRFFTDERRKSALLENIERAKEEFSALRVCSVEDSLMRFEIACFVNFHNMEDQYNYTLGAAIWILDELRRSGKLYDAYKFLPSSRMEIEEQYTPTDFYHPCYEYDLIQSVAHVIDSHHILTTTREQYIGLIGLLGKDRITEATEKFKALQWKATELFLKCEEYFDRNGMRRAQELKSIRNPGILAVRQEGAEDREQELMEQGLEEEEIRKRITAYFEDYIGTTERRIFGNREVAKILGDFVIENPYEICFAANLLVNYQDKAIWSAKTAVAVASAAGRMLPWYVSPEDWDEDEDPWEPMSFDRENGWLERTNPEADLKRLYTRGKGGKNLAQRVYGLCKGVMPVGFHPFEEERTQMKAEGTVDADLIADQAEVLFLSAFRAAAANFRGKHWWEEDELLPEDEENSGTEEQAETPTVSPVQVRGLWARVAAEQGKDTGVSALIDDTNGETERSEGNQSEADLTKELLERARKEIKSLRKSLAAISQEAESDKAKYEHELKALRMEHRELADLRELVFNRELEPDVLARREKTEKRYEYPYITRKRTVVFGGHESFLNAIKPMLPEARFVDPDNYGFNPEIVRNADVVWVQTNCISHSQYNNITRIARRHGIQLRYFAYASAEKCAEQLVEWDRK